MYLIVLFIVAVESVQLGCQNLRWAVHATYSEIYTVHRGVQNEYNGEDANVSKKAPTEVNRYACTHKQAWARRGVLCL